MTENLRDSALHYHRDPTAGKVRVQATKPLSNQRDLALAYSPGVAEPCKEIAAEPANAAVYTSRSNLVGVISNGTAVLGLGNIGPLASKPVMEGKAILFKNFANVDAYDIEIDELDVDKFCDIVAALEPTFGGINLEDIKAPECFEIEAKLRKRMNIPVFHDDQHGTAIVTAAAVLNGLRLINKKPEDVKLVVSGAGAAAMACTNLLINIGIKLENILMLDSRGVIHTERENLSEEKQKFAVRTDARNLADAMHDCDVFLGVSQPNLLDEAMLKSMAESPLILAMSNPDPEVKPEFAKLHRPDAIVATGRSDYPNQVNNVLCFPFLFRGALDVGATTINEEMKVACVKAIADLAMAESSDIVAQYYHNETLQFGPDYILPKPFDPRLITAVAPAVAQAAIDSGIASRPFNDINAYRQSLTPLVYRSGNVMRPIFEKAKSSPKKVVYTDGENERVLRAIQDIVDENYAFPILLGNDKKIAAQIKKLGLRIKQNEHYQIIHAEENTTKQACDLVNGGEADAALAGPNLRLYEKTNMIKQYIGLNEGVKEAAVMQLLLLDSGSVFIADTSIYENPNAEELASLAVLAAEEVKRFGMTPKVAMLSHSNFGSHETTSSNKMREACKLLKEMAPDLEVDGEMKGDTALKKIVRDKVNPNSELTDDANLLIMPNLDSASITFTTLKTLANGISVGPILLGTKKPIHVITESTTPRGIVNLTSLVTASVTD